MKNIGNDMKSISSDTRSNILTISNTDWHMPLVPQLNVLISENTRTVYELCFAFYTKMCKVHCLKMAAVYLQKRR